MQRHSSAKNVFINLSIGLFANVKVMKRTIEIIESDLELFMKWLDQKTCPELVKIDLKLKKINKCLLALLNFEEQFCFSSLMEEINYFKLKRPAIVKWDFFFRQLKVFEENFPLGGWVSQRAYIRQFQRGIHRFFKQKINFIRYLRNHQVYKDPELFNKNSQDRDINAMVQAMILFDEYLLARISELKMPGQQAVSESNAKSPLQWSDNKQDLILLAYALYEKRSINDGQITLKEIIGQFESLFNIQLQNHSRRFIDLKNKKQPDQFLMDLRDVINRKIDNLYL